MSHVDDLALACARNQLGLVRAAELRALGVATSTIRRRVARSSWREPHPGVMDVTGQPWTFARRAMAAVLYGPPGTVASHATAARLHGVLGFVDHDPVEVTVPRRARSRDAAVIVHSTVQPCVAMRRRHVPTSPLSRTALDLAWGGGCADRALARVVREAIRHDGLVERCMRDPWFSRARGAERLQRMVGAEAAHAGLQTDSGLEDLGIELLRRADLPRFTTQHPIALHGRSVRLDIAWPRYRVGVEVDGDAAHGDHLASAADEVRDGRTSEVDWVVVRLPEEEVLRDRSAAVARVEAALRRAGWRP